MKVAALKFTRDNSKVYYKTSLTEKEYTMANIIKKRNSRSLNVSEVFPVPKIRKDYKTVSVQKKKELTEMLKFMPEQDKSWYQVSLKI